MSAYRDFTSDYPSRCLEILDHQMGWAKFRGRDVTLLLMVASAAFVIPFERLRPDGDRKPHPSGDNKSFPEIVGRLADLSLQPFVGSSLCPSSENSWHYGKNIERVDDHIDQWFPSASLKPISNQKQVSSMLVWIRNALAHGGIFTYGNPIEKLILIQFDDPESIENTKCHLLSVSPEDFGKFVRGWVEFLKTMDAQELYLVA